MKNSCFQMLFISPNIKNQYKLKWKKMKILDQKSKRRICVFECYRDYTRLTQMDNGMM